MQKLKCNTDKIYAKDALFSKRENFACDKFLKKLWFSRIDVPSYIFSIDE